MSTKYSKINTTSKKESTSSSIDPKAKSLIVESSTSIKPSTKANASLCAWPRHTQIIHSKRRVSTSSKDSSMIVLIKISWKKQKRSRRDSHRPGKKKKGASSPLSGKITGKTSTGSIKPSSLQSFRTNRCNLSRCLRKEIQRRPSTSTININLAGLLYTMLPWVQVSPSSADSSITPGSTSMPSLTLATRLFTSLLKLISFKTVFCCLTQEFVSTKKTMTWTRRSTTQSSWVTKT